jgi:outer membrane protein assembly factor BamA
MKDKDSPHSIVGTAGLYTDNGSYGGVLAGRLYLKQDKYRVTVAGGGAKINADIYGIGKPAGDRGEFLPVTTRGSLFIAEPLFRLRKGVYLGARFQYRNLSMGLNEEKLNSQNSGASPPGALKDVIDEIGPDLAQQQTVALGPSFEWDTRDNNFYPRKGFFMDAGIDLFMEGIGSKFKYQYYKVIFNKYTSLGKYQVLAFRGMGCAAAGDHVPLYDLCLFGTRNDLRGYAPGRYQDRRMFATQAEYRLTLPLKGILGRFGIVAFGGVGEVGNKFSEFSYSDLLPAGGGGLRFRLTKKNPINFRVDYAVGNVGHTLSIGVGEAF